MPGYGCARSAEGLGGKVRRSRVVLDVAPYRSRAELFYSPDEIAALLAGSWTVEVSQARPHPASTPDGAEVTVHDTVLVATRPAVATPAP